MNRFRFSTKKYPRNKGAILALMVMLVLLLSLTSMALIGVAQQARLRTVKNVSGISARFAADAGAERVLYLMNQELAAGTWSVDDVPTYTSESLTACNADYTVTFSGNLGSGYEITSVGRCGSAGKTIRATIELSSPFANDYAVLTKNNLSMKNKSTVSGYNSANPGETDVPVAIGTLSTQNGSIDLKNGAVVEGDVYVGPDGDPDTVVDMKDDDSVEGEIFVMPNIPPMSSVSPPDYAASRGVIAPSGNLTLTDADSGKYNSVSVPNNKKITVDGDLTLYVTGDITLNNGAELKVKNGSSLKLYFDGNIEAKNSANITNESQIPSTVQLYGTGDNQTIDLKNSSNIHAVVYAPNANMTIHNKVNAYGSFIVDNFDMKNSGDVYYDKALKETSPDDEAIYFSFTHWEEY